MNQAMPLPQPAAAELQAGDRRHRDLTRLVSTWQSIAASLVAAESHDLPAEQLFDQLGAVETAIQDRHPAAWRRLEPALLVALTRWDHDGAGTAPDRCLSCRRLVAGLPLDGIPLPRQAGR